MVSVSFGMTTRVIIDISHHGNVEKGRQRRSRLLAVLTYSLLRFARPTMVAPFGMHQAIGGLAGRAFLTIPVFFKNGFR